VDELRERALAADWRKLVADGVSVTPVVLRRGEALKLVDGARTETVPAENWPARLDELLAGARNVHLLAPDGDLHARRTKKGRWLVSRSRPSSTAPREDGHDRTANRLLPDDHPLFAATHASRAKRRQVQHYVELLRPLPVWERERISVLDAGCGKAYMSLALVAYGREVGTRVELVGLDVNAAVVDSVRGIAGELGYDEAEFRASAIADYERTEPVDLLVSLHACDTATDEAIAAGIELRAAAIVVAPCCHHELAAQIAEHGERDAVLRHGLLLGRQADIVTDALRTCALEIAGYRVDVVEFVSSEHTAKNLMLRAELDPSPQRAERARRDYVELRDRFAVTPAIEQLLGARIQA
jgi:SAM-dependent methyltransferase